ncbi:MAG: sugar transporter substrate-binding protein, partial [Clostridia bacterium]|nr:sugar transporter substrate-binding protein [Clostridia bacterium]
MSDIKIINDKIKERSICMSVYIFKRIVCCFIVVICLFSFITACGTAEQQPNEEIEEEDVIDFYGYEFLIKDDTTGKATYALIPNYGDSEHTDYLLDHYENLRNKYNCEITVAPGTVSEFVSNNAAGVRFADMMNTRIHHIFTLFNNDMICDAKSLPELDLSSGKFGSQQLLDALTWNDVTCAVYASYWGIPGPNFSDALMYNPRILKEYELEDPQELYEKGTWNWAAFENMGQVISQSAPEVPEDKIYLSVGTDYLARMAMYSNDGKFVDRDSDGKYIFAFDSPNCIEALTWANNLNKLGYIAPDKGLDDTLEMFYTGKLVFFPEYSMQGIMKEGGSVGLYMEEEYRWCYYPKGPKGTDMTVGHISAENMFMAITNQVDTDIIGTFIDKLYDKIYPTETGWQNNYLTV